jgi:TolB-like protein/DNA-binding winged helix-turn-helix (wHTH) protein
MAEAESSSVGDFRLGDWLVQPSLGRITRDDSTITLELKVMEVLVCLAEHAGDLVTRQQLTDDVWATEFVSDNTLTHAVTELRKALCDDAKSPTYIETIHRKGYRLVAPVAWVAKEREPAGARSMAATDRPRWPYILAVAVVAVIAFLVILRPAALFKRRNGEPNQQGLPRIVVLPFDNLGSPDDEYFTDGVTDEITSRLAVVSGLQVISRTSAMQYKERRPQLPQIGEELNVGYVLEGSIRWDRNGGGHGRVRITPQLIRVADDTHLWSERYDRELEDIFTVQSDIAEKVVAQLAATLLESERPAVLARPTENMEAYQAYLLGVQFLQRSSDEPDMRLAIEMLERAVELDPEFALAHARLSETYSFIFHAGFMGKSEEVLTKAKDSAERALELQPGLPEAQRALGWYHYRGFRDYDLAREHFAAAAERLPNDPGVLSATFAIARRMGRWDEAIAAVERWRGVDPNNSVVDMELLTTYQLLRRYEKAEEAARRVTVATDRTDGFAWAAWNYLLWDGTTDRARSLLESAPSVKSPWLRYMSMLIDLLDRRPSKVMARLEEESIGTQSLYLWYVPRELLECVCLFQLGEKEKAAAS